MRYTETVNITENPVIISHIGRLLCPEVKCVAIVRVPYGNTTSENIIKLHLILSAIPTRYVIIHKQFFSSQVEVVKRNINK